MKLLKNQWNIPILLCIWTIWETAGGAERISSDQLDNYIKSLETPGTDNAMGYLLGSMTPFIFLAYLFASISIYSFYMGSNLIIKYKRVPKVIKYIISAVWCVILANNIVDYFHDMAEMWKWEFYLSAFVVIPFIFITIFILTNFYWSIKESTEG